MQTLNSGGNLPTLSLFQCRMDGLKSFGSTQQGRFCLERPYPAHQTAQHPITRSATKLTFFLMLLPQKKSAKLEQEIPSGYISDGLFIPLKAKVHSEVGVSCGERVSVW